MVKKLCAGVGVCVYSLWSLCCPRFIYIYIYIKLKTDVDAMCGNTGLTELPINHMSHTISYLYNEEQVLWQVYRTCHIRDTSETFVWSGGNRYWNPQIKISLGICFLNYENQKNVQYDTL